MKGSPVRVEGRPPCITFHVAPGGGLPARERDQWLPDLGPTALLVAERAMRWVEEHDGPVRVNAERMAAALGVGLGPLWRAILRMEKRNLLTVLPSSDTTFVVIGRWPGPRARSREAAAACLPERVDA